MNRFLDLEGDRLLTFDLNHFRTGGDGVNGVTNNNFIRIGGIQFFLKKVLIVVFKHGQSHAMVSGMPYQSKRNSCEVVAIKAIARVFDMCLKPYRW